MAIPVQPLMSWSAQGTVGDLTFCNRRTGPVVYSAKPRLKLTPSEKQKLQQWMFKHSAELWTLIGQDWKDFFQWWAGRQKPMAKKNCPPAYLTAYQLWQKQALDYYNKGTAIFIFILAMQGVAIALGFPVPVSVMPWILWP